MEKRPSWFEGKKKWIAGAAAGLASMIAVERGMKENVNDGPEQKNMPTASEKLDTHRDEATQPRTNIAARKEKSRRDDEGKIAKLRHDLNVSPHPEKDTEVLLEDPATELERTGFTRTGDFLIERVIDDNDSVSYKLHDETLPEEETATNEQYQYMQDFFRKFFPSLAVQRINQWEYTAHDGAGDDGFKVTIRVEADGSYTAGSVSGMDNTRNVSGEDDLEKVMHDKLELHKAYQRLLKGDMEPEEFGQLIDDMGYKPNQ